MGDSTENLTLGELNLRRLKSGSKKFASVVRYGKTEEYPYYCQVGKAGIFPCDNKRDAERNCGIINDALEEWLDYRLFGRVPYMKAKA